MIGVLVECPICHQTFDSVNKLFVGSEEEAYAIAAQEIASKNVSPGLMAKTYTDANGDEKKAILNYMKLRVGQLVETAKNEAQQAQAAQQQAQAAAQAEASKIICSECGHRSYARDFKESKVCLTIYLVIVALLTFLCFRLSHPHTDTDEFLLRLSAFGGLFCIFGAPLGFLVYWVCSILPSVKCPNCSTWVYPHKSLKSAPRKSAHRSKSRVAQGKH